MNAKKTKKEKKVEKVANPIEEMINNADSGIMITAKNGNVEVTGIKNVNFSYEAKGLLLGALDSYSLRPMLNALNNHAKNTANHINAMATSLKESKK